MKKIAKKKMSQVRLMLKSQKGATMVEYALMVALIAAVCIVTVTSVGKNADSVFKDVAAKLTTAAPAAP